MHHFHVARQLVEDRRRQYEETATRHRLIRALRRARSVDPALARVEPAASEEAPPATTTEGEIDVVDLRDAVTTEVALRE